MAFRHGSALGGALLALSSAASFGQTVTNLTNLPVVDATVYGFLLTDGRLLYQGGDLIDWWTYTPDKFGSYQNGTWQEVAALPPDYIPYATSGGVLADGRVLLIGGEYLLQGTSLQFTLTNKMAIYDPVANSWKKVKPPAGWGYIGDSPWTILANGQLLLGDKLTKQAAVLDPATLTWTPVTTTGKTDFNAEEGWTLLPDGSVLTVDVLNHPQTERFLPNANPSLTQWVSAGKTPGNLQASDTTEDLAISYGNGLTYHPPGEVGPAILRPDGTVFATGAVCNVTTPYPCIKFSTVGHTAIYHPGATPTAPGTWTAGPDFPGGVGAGDSYAALLPNGHVLVEANPAGTPDSDAKRFARMRSGATRPVISLPASLKPAAATPTWKFFEFDGVGLTHEPQADFIGGQASMLLVPTGEVMLNAQAIYTPAGEAPPEWWPAITSVPTTVMRGGTYTVSGTQFNGLSQANAFGDEFGVATNYPLVRLTNFVTGHVTYARTHDHSSMGVATGSLVVSTHFDVPKSTETGESLLEVVANGIASIPAVVTVQ